jgi:hypothetical protein
VNGLRSSHQTGSNQPGRAISAAKAILAAIALFSTVSVCAGAAFAQEGAMSPYQGEQDGVSAGGKWMEFKSEDKMTGAKRVRFELLAENYFKEDPDYKPRVELICEDGKLKVGSFNPAVRIGPNRPGWWGQPQLEVEVRIDDVHNFHGWNWQGRFVAMDKGTIRGIMQAHVLNIALPTRSGRQIAEFQPDGLNVDEVHHACDLTPKRPSKD